MLIVSRKIGESISIGDEITVTISDIKGAYVKLAVVAPRDRYPIMRLDESLAVSLLGEYIGKDYKERQEEKRIAKKTRSR